MTPWKSIFSLGLFKPVHKEDLKLEKNKESLSKTSEEKQDKANKNIADVYKNILCNLTTLCCVTTGYYFKVYCEPLLPKAIASLIVAGGICGIVIFMCILYSKLKKL